MLIRFDSVCALVGGGFEADVCVAHVKAVWLFNWESCLFTTRRKSTDTWLNRSLASATAVASWRRIRIYITGVVSEMYVSVTYVCCSSGIAH
jgi:hypothetical protein